MRYHIYRTGILGIFLCVVLTAHGTPLVLELINTLSLKINGLCQNCSAVGSEITQQALDQALLDATQEMRHVLECDPKLVDEADQTGQTPLMAAAFAGFDTIVALLLSYGAQVNRVDNRGKAAIDYVLIALSPFDKFSSEIARMREPFYRLKTHNQCVRFICAARCLE